MKEGTWIKISKTVTFSPNLYFPLMSVKNICLKTSDSEDNNELFTSWARV